MSRIISMLTIAGACLIPVAPATAVPLAVFQQSVAITDLGAPSTFSFSFFSPLSGVTGPVQVTTHVIGILADGGRDGASVSLAGNPTTTTGSMRPAGGSDQVVTAVGGAVELAAPGGSGGLVQSAAVGVTDTAAPSSFTFSFSQPVALSGNVLTQSQLGVVVMDLSGNGASVTGTLAGGALGTTRFDGRPPHALLGSGLAPAGVGGSTFDSDSALVDCSVKPSCSPAIMELGFDASGDGDTMAFIGRHEIGGDPLTAPVMAEYALQDDSAIFDCGALGCDSQTISLSFAGSGGNDQFVFIVRQEINRVAEPVPEPGSLALGGVALAALVSGRRRVNGWPARRDSNPRPAA